MAKPWPYLCWTRIGQGFVPNMWLTWSNTFFPCQMPHQRKKNDRIQSRYVADMDWIRAKAGVGFIDSDCESRMRKSIIHLQNPKLIGPLSLSHNLNLSRLSLPSSIVIDQFRSSFLDRHWLTLTFIWHWIHLRCLSPASNDALSLLFSLLTSTPTPLSLASKPMISSLSSASNFDSLSLLFPPSWLWLRLWPYPCSSIQNPDFISLVYLASNSNFLPLFAFPISTALPSCFQTFDFISLHSPASNFSNSLWQQVPLAALFPLLYSPISIATLWQQHMIVAVYCIYIHIIFVCHIRIRAS